MPEFNKPSCPACGRKDPVRHAKDTGEWYCWRKQGGCGNRWMTLAVGAAPSPPVATAPVISEPQKPGSEYHERNSDDVSDRERQNSIMRQTALKAAVELMAGEPDGGVPTVLDVAEQFNDWLHGKTSSPEQRAAQEATRTGGRYDAALAKQKPHVAATLKPNQSLADAAREAVANHDPLADDDVPPPWVGVTGVPLKETLKPSGPVRR